MSNQVVGINVWDHTKDRRTPDLRARYHNIEEQVTAAHFERSFAERVRQNVRDRALRAAEKLTQNVVQFARPLVR
jgi:hypothetical protein